DYIQALKWSAPPLLVYFAVRRYLQAVGQVRVITLALVTANIVNAAGNWVFVYGRFGAPRMGVTGSAWATFWARTYMAGVLVAALLWRNYRHHLRLFRDVTPDLAIARRLLALGLPAATH